jgi:hypothetical protein
MISFSFQMNTLSPPMAWGVCGEADRDKPLDPYSPHLVHFHTGMLGDLAKGH